MNQVKRHLSIIASKRIRSWSCAFTLIEVIGVVAVSAILATVLVTALVQKSDTTARESEMKQLETLANGLQEAIRRQKQIPSTTNWVAMVATELGFHTNAVQQNPRKLDRMYVIDPALRIGTSNGVLPYVQTNSGSIKPVSPRIVLLSSVSVALPSVVGSTSNSFSTLWSTTDGQVPSDWSWQGRGTDLKIQRVNLAKLFRQITLSNYPLTNQGRYSIEVTTPTVLVPTNGASAWFIEGTAIHFWDNSGVTNQASQILTRNASFLYERAVWRGELFKGLTLAGTDIELAASLFQETPTNPNSDYATQSTVVQKMIDFMDRYVEWAAVNFVTSPTDPNYATRTAVLNAQSALKTETAELIEPN
jgi:type II secretory pathway pseudopilin PulG